MIWSYGKSGVDDAYFYWDWCPSGSGESIDDPRWQIAEWYEYRENLARDIDRTFNFREFQGYTNSRTTDEMVYSYDAANDQHTKDDNKDTALVDLDVETLRHNIMKSYIEVSEWLGDGATEYGSRNGYVSRKMSLSWLFCSIRALINWKMNSQDRYGEVNIRPLVDDPATGIRERFLGASECST